MQVWQTEEEGSWLREYPVTLMQFLLFLYHNQTDFVPICLSADFLGGLVATLFPLKQDTVDSLVTTPSEEFKVSTEHSHSAGLRMKELTLPRLDSYKSYNNISS